MSSLPAWLRWQLLPCIPNRIAFSLWYLIPPPLCSGRAFSTLFHSKYCPKFWAQHRIHLFYVKYLLIKGIFLIILIIIKLIIRFTNDIIGTIIIGLKEVVFNPIIEYAWFIKSWIKIKRFMCYYIKSYFLLKYKSWLIVFKTVIVEIFQPFYKFHLN